MAKSIVNRVDRQEALHKFNRTHIYVLSRFMQIYANLCTMCHRHHVPIVYLRKQPIRETDLGHSPVGLNNRHIRGSHWLTAANYNRHMMTKVHST